MEFNFEKQTICSNETVFDEVLEQAVELDYHLPDYCRDIFKVLKCQLTPVIHQSYVSEHKLYIDGTAFIKVLYIDEESCKIRCIDQKMAFSKIADLQGCVEAPLIDVSVKCEYINCRVINPKRIDIRGSVSIRASVIAQTEQEVLSDVSGNHLQVCHDTVVSNCVTKRAAKQFSVTEELELSAGSPMIGKIIDVNAVASYCDFKIIANKVIIKSELLLRMIYTCEDESDKALYSMEHAIPVSQIIDIEGVDETNRCNVWIDVCGVEVQVNANCDAYTVQLQLCANCEAFVERETPVVVDAYSTCHKATPMQKRIKTTRTVKLVQDKFVIKHTVALETGEITQIFNVAANIVPTAIKSENGEVLICGNMEIFVLANDSQDIPCAIEKNFAIEHALGYPCGDHSITMNPKIRVVSISYNMVGDNALEVRCELQVNGCMMQETNLDIVSQIQIDEQHPNSKNDCAAVTIYAASKGEKIWDIAKRYSTSVASILEQNEIEGESIREDGMILIPMVD